jgi:esterase/lipase superfamily enzyme
MGNRGLTAALTQLVDEGETEVLSKFKEVILTAPDIDADIFKRDILPKITTGRRVTLYASGKDRALLASKELHAVPRAGDAGESLIVREGLDTIDATEVSSGFLGHSYFAENASVVSDIFNLIRERLPASSRTSLAPVVDHRGPHFRIKR